MADKPASPFARLDTSLLRSTRGQPASSPQAEEATPQEPEEHPPSRPMPHQRPSKTPKATKGTAASEIASEQASTLASTPEETIQAIRKTVKAPGREVSFVRLTSDEKAELGELVYTFKRRGKKTSENEINRIAVNFILQDHRENGERSVLARVIEALLA
jgi:hypothetical protein